MFIDSNGCIVEAILVGDILDDVRLNLNNVPSWVVDAFNQFKMGFGLREVHLNTKEGPKKADRSYWVIKDESSDVDFCSPSFFESTYKPISI